MSDSRFVKVVQIRDVHKRHDVKRELDQDGQQYVEIKDIAQGPFA